MPSQYTHAIVAEHILQALPPPVRGQIRSLCDYYAGAQGGDIFFFLRLTRDAEKNIGRRLHRSGIYASFCALLAAAKKERSAKEECAAKEEKEGAPLAAAEKECAAKEECAAEKERSAEEERAAKEEKKDARAVRAEKRSKIGGAADAGRGFEETAIFSYVAGYIAHYAADTVFHPFVYGMQEKLIAAAKAGEKGLARVSLHSYVESDLDTYFVRAKKGLAVSDYVLPSCAASLQALHPVVCAASGVPFGRRAFRRSFRRFSRYVRTFRDRTYRKRGALYAIEKVFFLPHLASAQCRRKEEDARCVNAEHALWRNPSVPQFCSREGAEELFARAVSEGVRLIGVFFAALQSGAPLPEADFNKHFLTGAEEKVPFVNPSLKKGKESREKR